MPKIIGIIPARYGSSRFEGKPLADLGGRPVIEHVYRRVAACVDDVVVATDDRRILEAVEAFGGKAVMTSAEHRSGTDRCLEAYDNIGSNADVVINIQGDEPFVDPQHIGKISACFDDPQVRIATLALPFPKDGSYEELANPNKPKLTLDDKGNALLFSRSVIPYIRGKEKKDWPATGLFHTHIGMYAFRIQTLREITRLPQSTLEKAESLEQLRWLQGGYPIRVALTDHATIGIDTPEDLEKAREILAKEPDRTIAPANSDFETLSLKRWERKTLPNGIVMHTCNMGAQPVSRLTLSWDGGLLDTDKQAALTLMAPMLTEGTEGMTGQEVVAILEANGAWFRAAAGRHNVSATLHMLNDTAADVLPVVRSLVSSPAFPQKALDTFKAKKIADKEEAMLKPKFNATNLANQTLYGEDSPLSHVVLPAEIAAVTREGLRQMHDSSMRAVTPRLFIAGRLDRELMDRVEAEFGSLDFGSQYGVALGKSDLHPVPFTERVTVTKDMPESMQTAICVKIPVPGRDHEDAELLRMAAVALGGYFSSRLMQNLREDKGYTYGVSAQIMGNPDAPALVIKCECDNKYAQDAVSQIDAEIRRLAMEEMDDDELETVKNVIISALAATLDTPLSVASFVEYVYAQGRDESLLATRFKAVKEATAADIMRVVRDYLLDTPRVTALAGKVEVAKG